MLIKELLEMFGDDYDDPEMERRRKLKAMMDREARHWTPSRRKAHTLREPSPEEKQASAERERMSREEHEMRMKTDPEYRERIKRRKEEWASYGEARGRRDPSVVRKTRHGSDWTGD